MHIVRRMESALGMLVSLVADSWVAHDVSALAGVAIAEISNGDARVQREKSRASLLRCCRTFLVCGATDPFSLYDVILSTNRERPSMATKKKRGAKKGTKRTAKKAARKGGRKAARKAAPRKKRAPNPAFMRPMQPDDALAAVVGSGGMPRTEITKKLWAYIKKNNLQDAKNKRMINADDKLGRVFNGKKQVSMFEMTKLASKHMK